MKMKATVLTTPYYFGKQWTLVLTHPSFGTKSFFLGQGGKVCQNLLNMHPSDVIDWVKSPNIEDPTVNARLGNLIVAKTGLTIKNVKELDHWSLAVE